MNYLSSNDAKALYQAFLSLKNEDECKKFLRDLLTQAEIKEFINRWKVARLLDKKVQYKKIEKQTGMSSTTIARINKWLQKGMGGYQLMINRFKEKSTNHHHITPRGGVIFRAVK